MTFNADSTGVYNGAYFGFEFTIEQSQLSLLSVEWDTTVSYRDGSSNAPQAIIEASTQIEILDTHYPNQWQKGIYTLPIDEEISSQNQRARLAAKTVIEHIENGGDETDSQIAKYVSEVNNASIWLNDTIYSSAHKELEAGRIVGLVGGDHSTPLGLIKALAEHHSDGFGILHIDAHMDLRDGYEGFHYSHASIMRRALDIKEVTQLIQVGVRDFSLGELEFATSEPRVTQFSDAALMESRFEGTNWLQQCEAIISKLPQKVYISFDIDGLDRSYCPSTGTPVPGGLSYNEAVYLILTLTRSGRTIIGFDLNEVCPSQDDEWDAIVGMRMLYKLCNATLSSNENEKYTKRCLLRIRVITQKKGGCLLN